MCLEDTVRIPLRARDGSVRAYALVDADVAAWVNQWRWCLLPGGYAVRITKEHGRQQTIYLHRELVTPPPAPGFSVDHISRDRLDNRRSNLRLIEGGGGAQNVSSAKRSSSRYRGVHLDRTTRKWVAQICLGGKSQSLGYFTSEEEAAQVAQTARLATMPYATD
jgi:hypothetical protein